MIMSMHLSQNSYATSCIQFTFACILVVLNTLFQRISYNCSNNTVAEKGVSVHYAIFYTK